MSARAWLAAMVVGTALVLAAGARRAPDPEPPAPRRPLESPWLTPQAAAEITGPGGSLGPLFEGVELGGPAPPAATRARIAAFARAHDVEIELEIIDDEVAAVRFSVLYGGCCGYEGADSLARRLGRPKTFTCCGCDESWIDDWAIALDGGVHLRGSVRVNRVMIRWERELKLDELVERADRLLGAERVAVGMASRDRWIEIEPGRRYVLELPYADERYPMSSGDALRLQIGAKAGRIVEIWFAVRVDESTREAIDEVLRARWGRPRANADVRTWRRPDRIVTAELGSSTMMLTIRAR